MSDPKVVVLFKHEDHDEQDNPVGPVWLELVIESEPVDDDPSLEDVATVTLGKLPWWVTRREARELADENGWFFTEDPPQNSPPPPMWQYDAQLASQQPTEVIESITVPDGRVDVWSRDGRWLVTWTADDPTHPRPQWTIDPSAHGGRLRDESIDAVREWVRDAWPDD